MSATVRSMRFQAAITQEEGGHVAQCLEVDVASQGSTPEAALVNLKEALELYFEDEPRPAIVPAQVRTVESAAPTACGPTRKRTVLRMTKFNNNMECRTTRANRPEISRCREVCRLVFPISSRERNSLV